MPSLQFQKIITSADADNRVLFLSADDGVTTVVREIIATISLASIDSPPISFADPLLSREERDAQFWTTARNGKHKRLNLWEQLDGMTEPAIVADCLIFGSNPTYVEDLLGRLTGIGELRLQQGTKYYLSISATNSGLLAPTIDKIILRGQFDSYA